MPTNISTIILDAPIEKIWNALTDPVMVKQWQFGSDLLTDWKTGSDIKFSTAWDGKLFEQWGKVLEVRTNELIRYSLFAPAPGREDKPENYFIMNYVLTRENGKTKLEILQEDDRAGAIQEEPQAEENPVLRSLKELVENS